MSTTEGSQPALDIDNVRQHLEGAMAHTDNLADQNRRFGLLPDITDSDMKAVAAEWLAVEQGNTLARLQANANQAQYRQLGERLLELEELSRPTEEEVARVQSAKEAIDREAELVVQIAPLGEQQTRALAEEKKQALDDELERDHLSVELREERIAINSLFDVMSEPWPVPLAASLEAIKDSNREIIREIIDEMPVDPTITGREGNGGTKRETHVIFERELTSKIIKFLSENPGRIISVRELCEAMYSAEDLASMTKMQARNLITTALGPKVKGPAVRKALIELGFTLQYGRRIERITDGGRTQTKFKRIYRVIDLSEFSELHTEPDDDERILWEITPDQVELLEQRQAEQTQAGTDAGDDDLGVENLGAGKRRIEAPNARDDLVTLFKRSIDRPLSYADVIAELYPNSTQPARKLTNRIKMNMTYNKEYIKESLAAVGLGLIESMGTQTIQRDGRDFKAKQRLITCVRLDSLAAEAQAEEADQEPVEPVAKDDDKLPASDETQAGTKDNVASNPPVKKSTEKKGTQTWETDFQAEVEVAIERLEAQGYINGGNLFPILGAKGNGSAETLLRYMNKIGLLSNTKMREKTIKAADLVAFTVSRDNRSLFREEKVRLRCKEIIDASLSRHYASRQQTETASQPSA